MTVEELIEELMKVEDKSAKVYVYDNDGGYYSPDEIEYCETDNTITIE